MPGAGTVTVKITGEASGLRRAFGEAGRDADSFGGRMGGLVKGLGALGAAAAAVAVGGLYLVGKGLASMTEKAIEGQKVAAETDRVIQSMGAGSWTSAEQVGELAGRLGNLTAAGDEAVQEVANLLLTFGNVVNKVGEGNDVFDQAVGLSVDLAQVLGTDAKGAALQLGKALNDPIKGITALSRAGVSFTEQQKEQIKQLVATGDILGAQKIILAEVTKQVGGAGEAYGKTLAGSLERLRNVWGDLQEAVMKPFIPLMATVTSGVADLGGRVLETLTPAFDSLGPSLERIGGALRARLLPALDAAGTGITTAITRWTETFKRLVPQIEQAIASGDWGPVKAALQTKMRESFEGLGADGAGGGIAASIAASVAGGDWSGVGRAIFEGMKQAFSDTDWGALGASITPAIQSILDKIPEIIAGSAESVTKITTAIIQLFSEIDWAAILTAAGQAAVIAIPKLILAIFDPATWWPVLVTAVKNLPQLLLAAFTLGLPGVGPIVARISAWLAKIPFAGRLLAWGLDALTRFGQFLVGKAGEALSWLGRGFLEGFSKVFPGVTGLFSKLGTGFTGKITELATNVWNRFTSMLVGIGARVGGWAGNLLGKFRDLLAPVFNWFKGAGQWLVQAGKDLVTGIWNGIKGLGGWLWQKVQDFFRDNVINPAKRLFGISSPSKLFAEYGRALPEGFAQGIRDKIRAVERAAQAMHAAATPEARLRAGLGITRAALGLAGGAGRPVSLVIHQHFNGQVDRRQVRAGTQDAFATFNSELRRRMA